MRTARKYYAAAVEASDGLNLRALFGLAVASAFLSRVTKGRSDAADAAADTADLGPLAEKRLVQVYTAKVGAERAGIVQAGLEAAAKGKK